MLTPDQPLDRPQPQLAEDKACQPNYLRQRGARWHAAMGQRKDHEAKPPDRHPKPEPKLAPRRAETVGVLLGYPSVYGFGP